MPLIEFVGYSKEDALHRIEKYRPMFEKLSYASDFIFLIDEGSKVIGLDGSEQPLVRVRSRWEARNIETRDLLHPFEDVEMLCIDFLQRADIQGAVEC